MADSLRLEFDFTGVTPASGSLAVLETGWYMGTVGDVKHFVDQNKSGDAGRLAVYLDTTGGRVRESFDLAKGQPFFLAFLVSVGAVKESPNKKVTLDVMKLVGKVAHFHYTAPPPSSGGGDTQYAKYRFVDAATFKAESAKDAAKPTTAAEAKPAQAAAATQPVAQGRPGAAAAKPATQAAAAATPAAEPAAAEGGDDLDFL